MAELLTSTREAILRTLLRAGDEGASLSQIADSVGIASPTAHKHLEFLIDEGVVEKPEGPDAPRYLARDFFEATWVDTDHEVLATWKTESIDWRFPLVTRVPDPPARRILTRFLEEATVRGLFHPWLQAGDLPRPGSVFERDTPSGSQRTVADYGVTVVVYGSCARGDAGASSDVDVLVIQPPSGMGLDLSEGFEDLAAEANLWADRQIEVKVTCRDEFFTLPESLQGAIVEEGITVYSTFEGGEHIEELEGDVQGPR